MMRNRFSLKAILACLLPITSWTFASSPPRPNIILAMADDMGWGDPSCYSLGVTFPDGSPHPDQGWISTPTMDAMAANGLRFDRFYSASAVCSPTRASCLTGRNPFRVGIPFANLGRLGFDETPLSEVLSAAGYHCGHFGKWHLGSMTTLRADSNRGGDASVYSAPWHHGYDTCFATESKVPTYHPYRNTNNNLPLPTSFTDPNFYGTYFWRMPSTWDTLSGEGLIVPVEDVNNPTDGDSSKLIVDQAIEFIEEANEAGKPFFLVLWFHTPHKPVTDPGQSSGLDSSDALRDSIEDMDTALGRLRNELATRMIQDNTMFWLTSDNGPEDGSNSFNETSTLRSIRSGRYLARKRSLHEGGVRVPGILEWPDGVPAARVTEFPAVTSDYYPTILDFLQLAVPDQKPIDGISLRPLIEGTATERTNPIGFLINDDRSWVNDRYKLINKGSGWELYDLINTPTGEEPEETPLATESDIGTKSAAIQQVYQEMLDEYDAWRTSVDTDMPFIHSSRPTVILSCPGTEGPGPFEVTATFNEPVEHLHANEFAITNGSASNLSGSGTHWTVTVSRTTEGALSVHLPEAAAIDADGNPNAASNRLGFDVVTVDEGATPHTVRIDFGRIDDGQPTTAPGWNNVTAEVGNLSSNTARIDDLIDLNGDSTGIALNLGYVTSASAAGSGADYEGGYPDPINTFPDSAISDSFFTNATGSISMTFEGLTGGATYDLMVYGARGNNGTSCNYVISDRNGNTTLNIANTLDNATHAPKATGLVANDQGNISMVISTPTGSGGGAINLLEFTVVPSPTTDTDGDGMSDEYESANGTDPEFNDAMLDRDLDGLTNLQEFEGNDSSSSPSGFGQTLSGRADSDNDGIKDMDELTGALNPWTSGQQGSAPGDPTNPNAADSDGDGVNDLSEVISSSDPNALPSPNGPVFTFIDSDGDLYSDGAEISFGSGPHDPDSCPDHSPNPSKPNIVIIYADDLGLGDMSAYGDLFGISSPAVTPRMDGLADQGVLFTQAHSSNGVCTASRYALLTGKYNWRLFNGFSHRYGYQTNPGMDEVPLLSDTTIAEFLKTQGYDTAAFGKWHLGGSWFAPGSDTRITGNPSNSSAVDWARPVENHATAHGFDLFRGLSVSINLGPYVYLKDDRSQIWDASLNGGSGAFRDATNSDTMHFFTTSELNSTVVGGKGSSSGLGDPSYRQVDAGPFMITQVEDYMADRVGDPDPFFAYVSLYCPHLPWALTDPFIGSDSANGFYYADWMREVDHRIGRVIDAIDNNGFHDNTLVILSSDNGPEDIAMSQSLSRGKDPNGPLRGNKRDVWDGGIRVPFIVRWPGQAAAGMKTNELIWQGDVFATVAAFLGQELPDDVAPDGESFLNVLRGQQKPSPHRDSIVVSGNRGDLALKTIDGWKLIDSTGGGGNSVSWDSSNASISNPLGTDQGVPKQLFQQSVDLGEDNNLISELTDIPQIRSNLASLTGSDLLAVLDNYRTTTTSTLFPRRPDNDADGMPNSFELVHELDPDSPKDANQDADGDGQSNLDEFITGTDPTMAASNFRVIELDNTPVEIGITWPTKIGTRYAVYWTSDLMTWHHYSDHEGTGALLGQTLDKSVIDAADGVAGNLSRCLVRVVASRP